MKLFVLLLLWSFPLFASSQVKNCWDLVDSLAKENAKLKARLILYESKSQANKKERDTTFDFLKDRYTKPIDAAYTEPSSSNTISLV